MKALALAFSLTAGFLLSACAHRIELPMTSDELDARPRTNALVAYLGQPDADPQVCGASARILDEDDLVVGLIAALRDGKVQPPTWGACVELVLPRLDATRAAELADGMVSAAAALVADSRAEQDPALRSRLETLVRTYLEREPGPGASEEALHALDVARRSSGPGAQRTAATLLAGLDLERGRWMDRRVDPAALDAMASDGDAGLLLRAARRLPDPALRAQAERILVRQRIAVSTFREVRAAGAALEAAVLERGTNPVSLAEHPPVRASLVASSLPARTVVVRQRPIEGTAKLLGRAVDRPEPSVLPAVSLRGAVEAELAGLSLPVTICAAGRALDPTPCIAASDVAADSPFARVRGAGDLRVAEQVSEAAAVELARQGGLLRIQLAVGGARAGALAWPVVFERPPDLVFSARSSGGNGPDLAVTVERLDAARVAYRVEGVGTSVVAVAEVPDAPSFRVVSRGARGADGTSGADGSDGMSGSDGSSAICPGFDGRDGSNGGDGSPGDDGGDGAPGGRGGDFRATVIGRDWPEATLELARASIVSEGGPGGQGGEGGRGGRGGPGGRGGSGATCTDSKGHTTWLRSGSSGLSGMVGRSGRHGRDGERGPPGTVWFDVAAR